MIAIHKSTIHARCPLNGAWDYYEVEVHTESFLSVENLEELLDRYRGVESTQEDITKSILADSRVPIDATVYLHGRHSQNVSTTCRGGAG